MKTLLVVYHSMTAMSFATPENLAAISGLMKDFFDRCYYPALDRINGVPTQR
jgi:multimeric flavodoxin WrbA